MESAEEWSGERRDDPTPWELWGPAPALERLVQGGGLAALRLPEEARVAVPGCGRGHDVRLLARLGLRVTGFDIAARAVAEARELLRLNRCSARVLRRDVLGLLPEFAGAFDLVYDHACYCALPLHLRGAYARVVAGILRPGGRLLALVFPMDPRHAGAHGPPYLVTARDLDETFGQELELRRSFATDAPGSPRAGAERWYVWRKKA